MPRAEPSTAVTDPAPAGEDVVADRNKLIDIGMGAVFAACVVFAVLRFAVSVATGHVTPWWGNAAGAAAMVFLYLWYRGSRSSRSSAGVHGTAFIASAALVVPAAYGMASSKWWLVLVGFSVMLMGRRREAIVWAWITVFLLPTVAVLEPRVQVPNAAGEPPAERAMAGFFFVVLVLGLTRAFRRVADRRARDLAETAASLTRANAVKSRFLAHMSHEVRTPLHGVIAMTDLAMEGDASPAVREQLETAQQSAQLLLALLNNILEVTRAESDALNFEQRPFLLHSALKEVLRPFAVRARTRGLTFTATADAGLAENRIGDSTRLGQIVLNLVGNALKFTHEGSIDVHLGAAPGDADRVVLTVADTGAGIAADKLEAIFEPFVQAREADARVQGGAGLGLAIVREVASRMDGRVTVVSEPSKGSTFRAEVRLAVDREAAPREGPVNLIVRTTPTEPDRVAVAPGSLSILGCEDNAVNRMVLRVMLERLGHKVQMVEDGTAAWELLTRQRFDLLVTDIELPGIDGLELTRRVREQERLGEGRRMPVIGATAHVGTEEQHRLLDAGLDAHLPKPFKLAELASLLERVSTRA